MAYIHYRFYHSYAIYHFYLLITGILIWIMYIIVFIVRKYIFGKDYVTISMDLYGKNQGTYQEEIDKIQAHEL